MVSDQARPVVTIAEGTPLDAALVRVRSALVESGVAEAAADARRLLAEAIGGDAAAVIRAGARPLSEAEAARLSGLATRRAAREPVSRILGSREFFGRPFLVTPDVLDPRPDTETLIEAVETLRAAGAIDPAARILDIGTGTGAILLTLLAEHPAATGLGVDVSPAALRVAEANAATLGLVGRAAFLPHDVLTGLPSGDFGLVVSNPPYIESAVVDTLDPEVRAHDPRLALDGGADGLDFYRAVLAGWLSHSHVTGARRALVLEVGAGQAPAVVELARKAGALLPEYDVRTFDDLAGHQRCVAVWVRPQGT